MLGPGVHLRVKSLLENGDCLAKMPFLQQGHPANVMLNPVPKSDGGLTASELESRVIAAP